VWQSSINDQEDGDSDDEHIGAKESGEHVRYPPGDGTIGLERPHHDPALLSSGAITRPRPAPAQTRCCTYRAGEFRDVDRTEL